VGGKLWVLGTYGHVFNITDDGTKEQIDQINEPIVGWGETEEGIWVATNDGNVRTYASESTTITLILPSLTKP